MTISTGPEGSASARVTCVECGQSFEPRETIRYQGNYVCRGCKDIYFERVHASEPSAPVETKPKYATFGSRFAAKLVDTLILYVLQLPLTALLALTVPKAQLAELGKFPIVWSPAVATVYALSLAISAAYQIYFTGRHGATPGKMALKIRVVCADGSALNYSRAAGRYLGELVSSLTCWLGYLLAAFDQEGRALHDHIAATRVVQSS
ncbi:MAG: RDD family protein [Myxococcota bacterium]